MSTCQSVLDNFDALDLPVMPKMHQFVHMPCRCQMHNNEHMKNFNLEAAN